MIPMMNIVAWGNVVPWAEQRQVEQDLIISRAIIDLFADPFLHEQLRFRGGTALNKLRFPAPIRYSEDIDLVRTTPGPIGPILDRVRERLERWLGRANFDQSQVAPKLRFRAQAEDPTAAAQPEGRDQHVGDRSLRSAAEDPVPCRQSVVLRDHGNRHVLPRRDACNQAQSSAHCCTCQILAERTSTQAPI
jgi:Nucleotidyl transferase AbiEii toxin, Type IV TA system